MDLYNKLFSIKNELNNWSKESFKEGLQIKLNRIEKNYNEAIEKNFDYILSRSNYKIFKALNTYNKKESKQDGKKDNRGFINII